MESNEQINTVGDLKDELVNLDEPKFENNNSEITPSLSDFELRKIKEELGMLDSGGEFDNSSLPLPTIYVYGNTEWETPFDFPLTEEERALLEQCTIGSPRRFSDSPSVCSTSLEQLADSLIKDFEDMDSDDEICFATDEKEMSEGNASMNHTSLNADDLKTPPPTEGGNLNNFVPSEERPSSRASKPTEDKTKNLNKSSEEGIISNSNGNSVSRQMNQNVDTGSSTASTSSQNGQMSEHTSRSPSLDDSDSLPASIDSGLPVNDAQIPQPNYFVVVAIDFGTTFSGYAFAFTRDPQSVHMMRRWEGGDPGVTNQKTPTTLLLKPDGSFHSFGFGARDFYHDLEPEDAKKWMYFEKFKMSLHSNKVML